MTTEASKFDDVLDNDVTTAQITVTARDGGFWWTLRSSYGEFESGAPTKDGAIDAATSVALGHGYPEDRIKVKK